MDGEGYKGQRSQQDTPVCVYTLMPIVKAIMFMVSMEERPDETCHMTVCLVIYSNIDN